MEDDEDIDSHYDGRRELTFEQPECFYNNNGHTFRDEIEEDEDE